MALVYRRAQPRRDGHRRSVAGLLVDRDGVLNRRVVGGYVTEPSQLEFLGAAVPLLARASDLGVPIAIVSNQGGLSRGQLSEIDLSAVHDRLVDHLSSSGVTISGIYVCPHHPEALLAEDRVCGCRKPLPGLLVEAAGDLGLDLSRSVFLGDQETDRRAAHAAGIPSDRFWLLDPERMTDSDGAVLLADVMSALGSQAEEPPP
jgi:D-glycero-D-manno-heptose 1,7-bisphosphate phosphatase